MARASPRSTVTCSCHWGLGGIAISTLAYSASTPFPGYAALLPVASTAMILAAGIEGRRPSPAARVLEEPAVRWPSAMCPLVLLLALASAGDRRAVHRPPAVARRQPDTGRDVAFAISVLTTRWFEDPIRHSKRLAPSRLGLVLWPVTVSLTLLVVAGSAHAIHDRLDQLAASIQPEAQAAATRRVQRQAESGSASHDAGGRRWWSGALRRGAVRHRFPTRFPHWCRISAQDIFPLGDCGGVGQRHQQRGSVASVTRPRTRTIGVYGDSHAQMWIPGIIRYARANRYVVVPLTKDGIAGRQVTTPTR